MNGRRNPAERARRALSGGANPSHLDVELRQGLPGLHRHRRRRAAATCGRRTTTRAVGARAHARSTPIRPTAPAPGPAGPRSSPPATASGSSSGARTATSITRRVVKTTPSAVDEQADVPIAERLAGGLRGRSGHRRRRRLVLRLGVASRRRSPTARSQQSRVLMNRLHGSQYDGIQQGDGLSARRPEGADQPQTAVTEYGDGVRHLRARPDPPAVRPPRWTQ